MTLFFQYYFSLSLFYKKKKKNYIYIINKQPLQNRLILFYIYINLLKRKIKLELIEYTQCLTYCITY